MADAMVILDGFLGNHYIADGFCSAPAVNNLMRDIITQMTKTSVSPSQWVVGQWEPGMWEQTPLTKIIKDLKK